MKWWNIICSTKGHKNKSKWLLMVDKNEQLYVLLICAILILAILAAYEPMRHNGFVNYDDDVFITGHQCIKGEINRESFICCFTTKHMDNWLPLTMLSHMLDCQLFGLNAFWHHLTSLLFHMGNTLLLFLILRKMTGALWPSAFVAALFAVHPLNVESVAWASERKTVLSGFFWMLTIATYIRYTKRPGIGRYLQVFLVFLLSLMSKPIVVTLPFVLLLLDYWPLERIGLLHRKRTQGLSESKVFDSHGPTLYRLFLEKVPLIIPAAALCVVTIIAQGKKQALVPLESWSLNLRIANAIVSYVTYIGKMFYPHRLAVLYPFQVEALPLWKVTMSLLILLVASAGVIYAVRQHRYFVIGWLWYIGTLVPVIGLVQPGSQARADRYFYLSGIGIFIILSWGIVELISRWHLQKFELRIAVGLILGALILCTRAQVRYWENDITLFGRAAEVTKNNYIMRAYYGWALWKNGQPGSAISHFVKALEINPNYMEAREYMAGAFLDLAAAKVKDGNKEEAIQYLAKAIQSKPCKAELYNRIGVVLLEVDEFGQAIEILQESLRIESECAEAHNNLAVAYYREGRLNEAVEHCREALRLKPDLAEARDNLNKLEKRRKVSK